ncbi:hypothetical protein ACQKF2_16400 [Pseudomonas hunanensis]|uniref:hypothetical protein n=1 Tax=Pseudomonas hunanensis TaxID=1247546 RepID=UPI00221F309C|nr:hypothetical protein DBADOPDK_03354 [Pseudomonas sp. MM223]CAI3804198.1 hypothetical protein GLGCALEP_03428 [Pseudomonas sp. MM221]
MSEAKRIEELEKGLDQALQALISLEARLGGEASQRLAADAALAARVDSMQALIRRSG